MYLRNEFVQIYLYLPPTYIINEKTLKKMRKLNCLYPVIFKKKIIENNLEMLHIGLPYTIFWDVFVLLRIKVIRLHFTILNFEYANSSRIKILKNIFQYNMLFIRIYWIACRNKCMTWIYINSILIFHFIFINLEFFFVYKILLNFEYKNIKSDDEKNQKRFVYEVLQIVDCSNLLIHRRIWTNICRTLIGLSKRKFNCLIIFWW